MSIRERGLITTCGLLFACFFGTGKSSRRNGANGVRSEQESVQFRSGISRRNAFGGGGRCGHRQTRAGGHRLEAG